MRTQAAMTPTWILVAHRAGARVLESRGAGVPLHLLREIDHPEGRAKGGEIDSDRPGSGVEGTHVGGHAFVRETTAAEALSAAFARELVAMLGAARTRGDFRQLVLVAPPRFLGQLRDAMDPPLARTVAATLAKDLPTAKPDDIRARLADVIRI